MSKRKLNRYAGDFGQRFQFFVRFNHTLVVDANPGDTIESVHIKIHKLTGIPLTEQRLIFRGKQLEFKQTLAEYEIEKDATLFLVGRLRSSWYPLAFQHVHDIVSLVQDILNHDSTILSQYNQSMNNITPMLLEFLKMIRLDTNAAALELLMFFSEASVPAFLIKLYVSSNGRNKEIAEDAITRFVGEGMNDLPRGILKVFAQVVSKFCELLRSDTVTDDKLYCLCRSSLASMIDRLSTEDRRVFGFLDLCKFVVELGRDISSSLSSHHSCFSINPSFGELVSDFSKFVSAITEEILQDENFCCPIELPVPPYKYLIEIGIFQGTFDLLIYKMDLCLLKIEISSSLYSSSDEAALSRTSHYLTILKDLYEISKLFSNKEEVFWKTMKRYTRALHFLVVTHATIDADFYWILDNKEATNFELRKHLAMLFVPEVNDEFEGEVHEMLINRVNLLSESFEYIAHAEQNSLRAGLLMEFINEEATGPGVLREWFLLVCHAIFDPRNSLYVACPDDLRRVFPNPASNVDTLHLKYFKFSGTIIALALIHKIQIGIVFDRFFHLLLAGRTITLEDIKDADPHVYSSCKQILEMDPEVLDQDVLGLTFVHEEEKLGSRKMVEFCTNGKDIVVNSENRESYVDYLIQHRFVIPITEQVSQFSQGFTDVLSCGDHKKFFRYLYPADLELMLYGSEGEICTGDWKLCTVYHGFTGTDVQISWFWKIVEGMTSEQKRGLLSFWTSIKYLPMEGFWGLASRLLIYRTFEDDDHLPSARTCFYRLCFPAYSSFSVMRDRLTFITQEHVGCSFGTL